MKATLASLGFGRSTAAPLQQYAAALLNGPFPRREAPPLSRLRLYLKCYIVAQGNALGKRSPMKKPCKGGLTLTNPHGLSMEALARPFRAYFLMLVTQGVALGWN